jgi:hypothetical protein
MFLKPLQGFGVFVYSYGDSAGFSPDFPFNPTNAGTKFAANVETKEKQK